MRPIVSSFVLVAAFAVAPVAMAQQASSGDVEYCRLLAKTYMSQNPVQSSPTASDSLLADGCTRDTQATTAVLKEKITSHGIDMPKPPTMASGDGSTRSTQ